MTTLPLAALTDSLVFWVVLGATSLAFLLAAIYRAVRSGERPENVRGVSEGLWLVEWTLVGVGQHLAFLLAMVGTFVLLEHGLRLSTILQPARWLRFIPWLLAFLFVAVPVVHGLEDLALFRENRSRAADALADPLVLAAPARSEVRGLPFPQRPSGLVAVTEKTVRYMTYEGSPTARRARPRIELEEIERVRVGPARHLLVRRLAPLVLELREGDSVRWWVPRPVELRDRLRELCEETRRASRGEPEDEAS